MDYLEGIDCVYKLDKEYKVKFSMNAGIFDPIECTFNNIKIYSDNLINDDNTIKDEKTKIPGDVKSSCIIGSFFIYFTEDVELKVIKQLPEYYHPYFFKTEDNKLVAMVLFQNTDGHIAIDDIFQFKDLSFRSNGLLYNNIFLSEVAKQVDIDKIIYLIFTYAIKTDNILKELLTEGHIELHKPRESEGLVLYKYFWYVMFGFDEQTNLSSMTCDSSCLFPFYLINMLWFMDDEFYYFKLLCDDRFNTPNYIQVITRLAKLISPDISILDKSFEELVEIYSSNPKNYTAYDNHDATMMTTEDKTLAIEMTRNIFVSITNMYNFEDMMEFAYQPMMSPKRNATDENLEFDEKPPARYKFHDNIVLSTSDLFILLTSFPYFKHPFILPVLVKSRINDKFHKDPPKIYYTILLNVVHIVPLTEALYSSEEYHKRNICNNNFFTAHMSKLVPYMFVIHSSRLISRHRGSNSLDFPIYDQRDTDQMYGDLFILAFLGSVMRMNHTQGLNYLITTQGIDANLFFQHQVLWNSMNVLINSTFFRSRWIDAATRLLRTLIPSIPFNFSPKFQDKFRDQNNVLVKLSGEILLDDVFKHNLTFSLQEVYGRCESGAKFDCKEFDDIYQVVKNTLRGGIDYTHILNIIQIMILGALVVTIIILLVMKFSGSSRQVDKVL